MKTTLRIICFVAALLSLLGCNSINYNTQVSPNAKLSNYHTFTILPLPEIIRGLTPEEIAMAGMLANKVIKAELKEKGYQYTSDGEAADLMINISSVIVPQIMVSQYGFSPMDGTTVYDPYYGYGRGTTTYYNVADYYSTDIQVHDEGSLQIEFYDTKTKKGIWVGSAKRESSGHGTIRGQYLKESVEGILASVPDRT